MSATPRTESASPAPEPAPRDIAQLQGRRREANRRRRLLRIDVVLGLLVGIVLLVLTPGLAVAAIFAGALLAGIVLSELLRRRRERERGLRSVRGRGWRREPEARRDRRA